MNDKTCTRRHLLQGLGVASLGALASARVALAEDDEDEGVVIANEDLMREHGVIRRALLVYGEAARRAHHQPSSLSLPSLVDTARLFRQFAEDYHERALEEVHIFPIVRKVKGPASALPDVLAAQHQRGRDITDYVLAVATRPKLAASDAEPLARALDAFVHMYEPHAAQEDTVLFPAWKAALGRESYAEMGERFEEIEQRTFGHDGFDEAVERIARIEEEFGLADLAAVTAPPPPPRT